MSSQQSLSQFLLSRKSQFLRDLGNGQASSWTLAIGNVAGDLDSAACSIAYAFLHGHENSQIIPVILTPRKDLHLRPENTFAFSKVSIHPPHDELLTICEIPDRKSLASSQIVLVDQNVLPDIFGSPAAQASVIAIIDHHKDERKHLEADPRIINLEAGSCSSLIAKHFIDNQSSAWTSEIATLLLCAMCIDTAGFKPGKKATNIDVDAANFLIPIMAGDTEGLDAKPWEAPQIESITAALRNKKDEVGGFTNLELLRRDYKPYSFGEIRVGLSTVPWDLKEWVNRDPGGLLTYMDELNLTILGVLSSLMRHGDHKRQQFWIVKRDASPELQTALWRGLERSGELQLDEMKDWKEKLGFEKLLGEEIGARAYKQGNARATRKAVAPLVATIVKEYLGSM